MKFFGSSLVLAVSLVSQVRAIELDLTSEDSVNGALSSIAYDMMTYYQGNETGKVPGILPGPCQTNECYYWWVAGGMWGALINYYQYTGDSTYQDNVLQALAFQIGPDQNYNPPNQSKNLGMDDQAFWGFAALEAAEAGIPNADDGTTPSWISLAQAVFDFQVQLWDAGTCDGGFRWQVYSFNAGYNLKNTISNAAFFNLAARLARYTGNSTYSDWAVKVYDWLEQSKLMETTDGTLYLWDNVDVLDNCSSTQNYVWTYNYGALLVGSAYMYNHTNGSSTDIWKTRIDRLLDGAEEIFFAPKTEGIMSEIMCEDQSNCNSDQSSFKAYLSRWMAVTSVLAPYTAGQITPLLTKSAQGAAAQCVGGANGRKCGRQWYTTTWDGSEGVGQQMSALAVIGATRMTSRFAPLRASDSPSSSSTGGSGGAGNSQNSNNGSNGSNANNNGNGGTSGASQMVITSLFGPVALSMSVVLISFAWSL